MLDIRIAKPCDPTWTAMKGDERVRHCGACRKNVYNIAAMTEKEVEDLVRRTEGRFCARVYRRTDGRVLTADCPKGVAAVRRKRTLAVTGAFAAFVGVLNAMPVMGGTRSRPVLREERIESPAVNLDDPVTGIVAHPIDRNEEETLGKIAVPSASRKGAYQVEMGAPAVAPHGVVIARNSYSADE